MSMKKTDLEKNLAKRLDGKLRAAGTSARFGKGSEVAPAKGDARSAQAVSLKPVLISCRLPAHLAKQLRERATAHAGGINALIAQAVEDSLRAKSNG